MEDLQNQKIEAWNSGDFKLFFTLNEQISNLILQQQSQ
jgi:hypothetical protein